MRTRRFLAFGLAISAAVSPAFADPAVAAPEEAQDFTAVDPVVPPSAEDETPPDETETPSLDSSQAGPVKSIDPNQVPTSPTAPPDQTLALPTGADKSGVTSKSISVPKGSGTIQGMGESFSAQLSTGIATFSVPFALPAARGGAQPSLGLSYSSSGGFGLAGVGWSIGVPFIARQTDRGVPNYAADAASWQPNQDRFVFNGGQELVPICTVSGGTCAGAIVQEAPAPSEVMPVWADGWQYFRPRVEGSFLRFFWSPDHLTWRVQDKSGVTMELGVPLDGSGYANALERNPDDSSETYRWHLVRQYDTWGTANPSSGNPAPVNVVVFRYFQDGASAYLSDIYDTPPASGAATAPLTNYAHHTRLVYTPRSDPTHSFRSGWRMERNLRLSRVDVTSKTFNAGVTDPRVLVRRYHLQYDAESHASLLASVQVEGRCAGSEDQAKEESAEKLPEATNCARLPAMEFSYSHVTPYTTSGAPGVADLDGYEGFDERLHNMTSSPPHSVDEELTDLFDVNADSLPDVLVTAAGVYGSGHGVFFNGAGGNADAFGAATPMSITGVLGGGPTTIKLSNLNIAALDLDGDAITDLLHMPKVKSYAVYSPLQTSSGGWTWKGRVVDTSDGLSPKIDLGKDGLDTQVMDVDFDGLVDVVITTGTEVQTYFSLGRFPGGDGRFGRGSWTGATTATLSTEPVRTCVPWSATPVRFSDSDIKTADMNGDGITDIVRVRKGDIRYWPGRGNGFWGTGKRDDCGAGTFGANRHVLMGTSPQYSDIQGDSLRLDDVNGDGLTDLVQIRFDEVDVWLNVDGKGWTERHIIDNTPASPSYANRVRLVDVNGSGTRDILWGNSSGYKYLDVAGGSRPSVLVGVKNGLGKSTTLEYSTSATEMLAAEKAGTPWSSRMPISAHVVKRVTESDELTVFGSGPATYVTEYTYRDPVYDGRQREFRGFRFASARRIGDANSPTDITESTFLLGECVDETPSNGKDECAISERWRDNPREALKGLPVISEKRNESSQYLSTDLTRYRLRKLYTGLDGREVRHAFELATDSYIYDVYGFTAQETTSSPTTVETELEPPDGPSTELSTTTPLKLRSTTGRVHIQGESEVDVFGNRTKAIARGCTDGCTSADEVITTTTDAGRPASDPTGWLWRTMSSVVTGDDYFLGSLQETTNTYNAQGALVTVAKELENTVELERFHAGGGAVADTPSDASSDGTITWTNTYDSLGNLTRERAPDSRCRDVGYEEDYAQLADSETIFRNGCDSADPFTSGAAYDRSLALVTQVIDLQSQHTRIEYDAFGRLVQLTRPHPNTAQALSPLPSVKIEYFLPTDLGTSASPTAYSLIHTMTHDGADLDDEEYLESWSYVDGLGRTLLTLNEADTSAGADDDEPWIATGRVLYDKKGAVARKYLDAFYGGAPKEYPLAAALTEPHGAQIYDAFGRVVGTMDLDGTVTLESHYHALSTDHWDAADLDSAMPASGTYATEIKDGHGRAAGMIERFREGTTLKSRETTTTFLPTGEPLTITRKLGGTSTEVMRWMRYDSLGRMVVNVEPNTSAGFTTDFTSLPGTLKTWHYVYNDSGDLVGTSDARGCGVNFGYDKVGRLQYEEYSPCETHHLAHGAPNFTSWNNIDVYYHYDSDPNDSTTPAVIADDTPVDYFATPYPTAFLRGRLVAVYDMGAISVSKYDGRGRVIGTARKIAKPGIFASGLAARYTGHWFEKTTTFDSADREVATTTGASVSQVLGGGSASEITTTYSRRGTVKSASGSYGDLVKRTKRTADGLMAEIEYGDAATTTSTYTYDNRRRLESAQTTRSAPNLWTSPPGNYVPAPTYPTVLPSGQLTLQYDAYEYDVVSNPTTITDLRTASEWPNDAKPVDRVFEYDAFYRLTKVEYTYNGASEWKSPFDAENTGATDPRLGKPVPHVQFDRRIGWQTYAYDWLGNTSTTDDDDDGFYDRSLGTITNSSTKPYQLESASNETTPGTPISKEGHLTTVYDAAGNLTELRVLRNGTPCLPSGGKCNQVYQYLWDEVGRLVRARRWDVTAANINTAITSLGTHSAEAINTFDASDERVIEQTYGPGGTKQNVFVFDTLDLRRTVAVTTGSPPVTDYPRTEWTEVPYLFVNGVRLARVVYNDSSPEIGANETHVFLEIGDHLGSTSVVIDRATGELVERGTYQAYGAAESDYRPDRWQEFREDYRFTGKEEDVQVGLTYFGKRFLSPYLNRWVSADPLTIHALGGDPNVYAYVHGRALKATDPRGLAESNDNQSVEYTGFERGDGGLSVGTSDGGKVALLDEVTVEGSIPERADTEPPSRESLRDSTPVASFFLPVPQEYVRQQHAPPNAPQGLESIRQLNGSASVGVANFSRDQAPGTDVRTLTLQTVSALSAAGTSLAPLKLSAVSVAPSRASSGAATGLSLSTRVESVADPIVTVTGEFEVYGPFTHVVNKGGYSSILSEQELISTTGRFGDEAVRATTHPFKPVQQGQKPVIEFFTQTPPSDIVPTNKWSFWYMPEGERLPIWITNSSP